MASNNDLKVEILTIHFGINHGSVLQCYALCETLRSLGAKPEVLDYVPARYRMWSNVKIKHPSKSFLWRVAFFLASSVVRFPQKLVFRSYLKRHLTLSRRFSDGNALCSGCPEADLYIVGSDQVWNSTYNGRADKSYLLDFLPEGEAKASYAASIGRDEVPEDEGIELAEAVRDFIGVSVRESSAKGLLADFGVNARVDLDPVFLLTAQEWGAMASSRARKVPYVLVYVIAQGWEPMIEQAREIAKARCLDLIVLSVHPIRGDGIDHNFIFSNPSDFLGLFRDADFVLSNSFHGTAFSIIFRRQFLTFATKYNTRIESILQATGLESRLVRGVCAESQFAEPICYDRAAVVIKERAAESVAYLADLIKAVAP